MSVLEQLKNYTTIVADSGDFECKSFLFLFLLFVLVFDNANVSSNPF
jgi:hypothetical protein